MQKRRVPKGILSVSPRPEDYRAIFHTMQNDSILRKRVFEVVSRSLRGQRKRNIPLFTCIKMFVGIKDKRLIAPMVNAFEKSHDRVIRATILQAFATAGFTHQKEVRQFLQKAAVDKKEKRLVRKTAISLLRRN